MHCLVRCYVGDYAGTLLNLQYGETLYASPAAYETCAVTIAQWSITVLEHRDNNAVNIFIITRRDRCYRSRYAALRAFHLRNNRSTRSRGYYAEAAKEISEGNKRINHDILYSHP